MAYDGYKYALSIRRMSKGVGCLLSAGAKSNFVRSCVVSVLTSSQERDHARQTLFVEV